MISLAHSARYRPETHVISQLVMFVEDLNMPLPEQYGAQPPLEFLRQFIGNDGFYDINRYSWKVRTRRRSEDGASETMFVNRIVIRLVRLSHRLNLVGDHERMRAEAPW